MSASPPPVVPKWSPWPDHQLTREELERVRGTDRDPPISDAHRLFQSALHLIPCLSGVLVGTENSECVLMVMYDPDIAPNFVAEFRDYMPLADYDGVRFVAQRFMSFEESSLLVDDPNP